MKKVLVEVLAERLTDQKEVGAIVEEEEDNWMTTIIRCLADGVWPIDKDERRALRMLKNLFSQHALGEIHMGSCGMHIGARSVASGLVERANKSLLEGIKARLGRERAGWVDELPNVLWAHCSSLKQSNGETPFSLTYGSEAERREASATREAKYNTKMEQYYNKKVRPTSFKPDEYVFRKNEASRVDRASWVRSGKTLRVDGMIPNGPISCKQMGEKRCSDLARHQP
ncbi:reverse transcriptase domain-containing protein [Tanacetum coccineum]